MPKILPLTRFGNPLLRRKARRLPKAEVMSADIQNLIADIRYTNKIKEYGLGLAAPQVGENIALSVIGTKPTPNRPDLETFDSVIINPSYEGIGPLVALWEGCQSAGSGEDILFGQAQRYTTIQATWYDEQAVTHTETLTGLVAHVFQHETDHLNGTLFVDRVLDPKTYMMADEYRKRIVQKDQRS